MVKAISDRISETVRYTPYRLLLSTNKKWQGSGRLDGNHWPWMTLKVIMRYCG